MRKKNFKVTAMEDGKEYWISPSVVVVCTIIVSDPDTYETYILANKRGKGAVKEVGKWSVVAGYLDFGDKSIEGAAVREVYEETGLKLNPNELNFTSLVTIPKDGQVSFRFMAEVSMNDPRLKSISNDTESRGGEADEVEELALIKVSNLDKYKWAFNHKELIKEYF